MVEVTAGEHLVHRSPAVAVEAGQLPIRTASSVIGVPSIDRPTNQPVGYHRLIRCQRRHAFGADPAVRLS